MSTKKLSPKKQAELIEKACREHGLDEHIKWIQKKEDAQLFAEAIAEQHRDRMEMPVKNSFMYCDALNMCFFYDATGIPCMSYSGYAFVDSQDLCEGNIQKAFEKAKAVLQTMAKLSKEAEDDSE